MPEQEINILIANAEASALFKEGLCKMLSADTINQRQLLSIINQKNQTIAEKDRDIADRDREIELLRRKVAELEDKVNLLSAAPRNAYFFNPKMENFAMGNNINTQQLTQ